MPTIKKASPELLVALGIAPQQPGKMIKARIRKKPWINMAAVESPSTITVTVPVEVISEANEHKSWFIAYRRKRDQARGVKLALTMLTTKPTLPATITLTRVYCGHAKPIDEHDNLKGGFKAIVDALADWLIPGMAEGRADSDSRFTWNYQQRRSDVLGVEINIVKG